jgi:hypothetical protein
MVVANIEKTVSPVPERLMYLKKQTNGLHFPGFYELPIQNVFIYFPHKFGRINPFQVFHLQFSFLFKKPGKRLIIQ